MNVSDTCNAAADLIEVRGWEVGEGWNLAEHPTAPLCLEGALMAAQGMAASESDRNPNALLELCPAYLAVRDHIGRRPFCWNDLPGRTAEQVIATLRAVAVIHAAREDESVETRTVEAVTA